MSRALRRLGCKYGASPIFSDNEKETPHIVEEFESLWENLPFFSFDIWQKKLPQTKSAKKVSRQTESPDRRKETLYSNRFNFPKQSISLDSQRGSIFNDVYLENLSTEVKDRYVR